jgi:UDP-N-acetylglucosamine transferase subunit ALG13
MKKHIRLLNLAALLLVLSAPVMTLAANGDEDVRKQRLINKQYTVAADDKLEIDNQFGNVVVSTWDKNEITVDIEISARASSEERAQDIMNRIDVKDGKDGHSIWFKTKVGEIHNNNNNHGGRNENERGFYIDYVIHMPASNRLDIANSFGKTEIPAFKGLITLTSKFGSLNTGKLDNVDQIDVEFGKAYITSVNNGKVIFKFNKESRIGKVDGNVKISSEFSQNVQFNIADEINELSVVESYSGVRMVVNKDLSAQFDVHTSFGKFHNESEFTIAEAKEDKEDWGPKFDKDYSGKAGDGRAKIRVKSSFGSVRLSYTGSGDNNSEDEGDDDDDKGKNKNKSKHKDKDKDRETDSEAR